MNKVKKPMILVGIVGGFMLFLMSIYRLFIGVEKFLDAHVQNLPGLEGLEKAALKAAKDEAKAAARPGYDKISFILLGIAIILIVIGIWCYFSATKAEKQIVKKNPGAASPYLRSIRSATGFINRIRPAFIMLLAGAVFACMHERFLTFSNLTNVLNQNAHYGILAAGVCFAILIGGIDISLGSVLAFAGMVASLILAKDGSLFVAILVALLIGAFAGFFNGFFIARFKLQPMIVTLATMSIFRGATMVISNAQPISVRGNVGSEAFVAIGQEALFDIIPWPVIILIVVYLITYYILNMTSFGRHIYAIGGNEDAARLSGINVQFTKIMAHTLCGVLAGVAGIIVTARVASAAPTAGDGYEMDAIAAAVIGGISLRGGEGQVLFTIVGAIIIGMLNNILKLQNVQAYWQTIIKGCVILFAVLLDSKPKD